MKQLFSGILVVAMAVGLYAAPLPANAVLPDSTRSFISEILNAVTAVDSVRYGLITKMYVPGDSFYISEKISEYVECKNPADTSLLAKFVERRDGNKMFTRAYFGDSAYYYQDNYGYMNRSDGKMFGFKTVSAPFFNHATSILNYFLTSDRDIKISIADCGDNWLVSGDIPCDVARICFYGKPREMPSFPYPECVYDLLINKTDSLPRRISYQTGNPPFVEVNELGNFEYCRLGPDDFNIEKINVNYAPCFDSDASGKEMRKHYEAETKKRKELSSKKAPDFELIDTDGDTLRLADFRGQILLLFVTSATCPHATQVVPVLNKISADYDSAGVKLVGVYTEPTMHPKALSNLKERNGTPFPLAIDRRNCVVEAYYTGGLTPILYLIDRNGILKGAVAGASHIDGVYDKDVRKIVDGLLAE